ncbi:MAG: hypothetical protein GX313_05825 [Spirochaetales bacterium]|nr:hypothetical protein [Spirochaetales bacterium]
MKAFLIIVGIVAVCMSIVFFVLAYDKYANYYNPESKGSYLYKNVYVGGDAYNYIINGTYFTGFSVLGIGALVLGFLCFGLAYIGDEVESFSSEVRKLSEAILRGINDVSRKM